LVVARLRSLTLAPRSLSALSPFSLHDALPISARRSVVGGVPPIFLLDGGGNRRLVLILGGDGRGGLLVLLVGRQVTAGLDAVARAVPLVACVASAVAVALVERFVRTATLQAHPPFARSRRPPER